MRQALDPFLACYLGRVQGNSPGCFSAHQSPLHSEVGSCGGPHHGTRSKQMRSSKSWSTIQTNPMSINVASMIESAISVRESAVVTAGS
jgi:hypothetical protein